MSRSSSASSSQGRAAAAGSFFRLYKRGQGYYTRLGTAIGLGVIALAGANYLFDKLGALRRTDQPWTLWVQTGVPLALLAGVALLVWWLIGVKRGSCDFMIATEGEMKKVNWSSRKEVIGSTKVVIAVTLMMAAMLFVVDILFASFFGLIGVLQANPIGALLSAGSGS